MHERGYPSRDTVIVPGLPETGEYHWRDGGEAHINDPTGIAQLQNAVREKNQSSYDAYAENARRQVRAVTLRGLLDFDYEKAHEIPLEQVEPWHEIVKRFVTGAMSYGSISMEAHSSLAIAMNRIVSLLPSFLTIRGSLTPSSFHLAGRQVQHRRGRRGRRALRDHAQRRHDALRYQADRFWT